MAVVTLFCIMKMLEQWIWLLCSEFSWDFASLVWLNNPPSPHLGH